MSCISDRVGVSYERDTCSFTCNTGYELTDSGIRICQSNGSWSGRDTLCGEGKYIWHTYHHFIAVTLFFTDVALKQ